MRDTESLHPLCWRGTYSYGKSLNVLVLAVLDDLLQSIVVMWFSISHYDHDLFNAPPGTPGFSECLFPEGNTDQSEADQTQPRVGQHEKPYKNTSTPRSLAHPPEMTVDSAVRGMRHRDPSCNISTVPHVMGTHRITTCHICLYKAQAHPFFGCCITRMSWLMSVWERMLMSTIRSEAGMVETTDRGIKIFSSLLTFSKNQVASG